MGDVRGLVMLKRVLATLVWALVCAMPVGASEPTDPQLLRKRYLSAFTGEEREYYVYLPRAYGADRERRWPLILFLHGAGERGDGLGDLEKVLAHGPLMEAWVLRRDLPFVIVAPQAPFPDGRKNDTVLEPGFVEQRDLRASPPPRPVPLHSTDPIPQDWGTPRDRSGNVVNVWVRMKDELFAMVEETADAYRVDRHRLYLTGLSMGGIGTFGIAAARPNYFAALAPIAGGGHPDSLDALAKSQRPIWIFHGGRDRLLSPIDSLKMANALLAKGHRATRFTVHHDLDHDAWIRVYEGEDLYAWLLAQSLTGAHPP